MFYQNLADCVKNARRCIRLLESGLNEEEYDTARIRLGMVSCLSNIKRVGVAECYVRTHETLEYHLHNSKSASECQIYNW